MSGMIEIRGVGAVPRGKFLVIASRPNWQEMNERLQGELANVGMILFDPWANEPAAPAQPAVAPSPIEDRVARIIVESLLATPGLDDGIRRAAHLVLDEVRTSLLDEALVEELAFAPAKCAGDVDRFHCRPDERNRYLDTADGVMRDLIATALPWGAEDDANG